MGVSLVAPMVKNLPAMQETWVPSLRRNDPLEEEMATHSSIPAWRAAVRGDSDTTGTFLPHLFLLCSPLRFSLCVSR